MPKSFLQVSLRLTPELHELVTKTAKEVNNQSFNAYVVGLLEAAVELYKPPKQRKPRKGSKRALQRAEEDWAQRY